MFLYNRQSTTNEKDAAVPNNFEGYTMQLGYKYKNKFYEALKKKSEDF